MPTFEYMRLSQSYRGSEAIGPGSEKFAAIENFDEMLAALGADGWELVTALPGSSESPRVYFFKRQVGSP
jgi:hypothetical protein